MTEFLFRDDPYAREAPARVVSATPENGVVLDRTVFYATSGGQPGDTGTMRLPDGSTLAISGTIHPDGDKTQIAHLADGVLPRQGDAVVLALDWERRYRLMRMHSALHLLSVAFPFPVTGGSVGTDKGRLDFDMPEVPEDLKALEAQLNTWIKEDYPIAAEWITDAQLAANPGMVKTMKVKPPAGQGRVRLIRIGTPDETIDLQPCGGTHVASTAEIGPVTIGKVEKKGKQNRRVSLLFA
ncbi:alanyl-tRNA editing protein [Pelagibacterium xiamenense]|uniref:alanyl-tRNA editing protein n=1 Tax=Pelagibacterium xiamenense TaxID=2901140 RepID=UPI001E4D7F6B|nr:alanyl-tRNA editing protein [Pelagibacterium xiamenense]MCD7060885.1 alanyl-tRNA editing protein [Pelagibacterium xiamenense]